MNPREIDQLVTQSMALIQGAIDNHSQVLLELTQTMGEVIELCQRQKMSIKKLEENAIINSIETGKTDGNSR